MKRAARTYSSIIALIGIALIGIACLISPRILSVVHHYANFIAVGRSSVKITVILVYAALAFGVSLIPLPFTAEKIEKLYRKTLYGILALTALSTLGMGAVIAKLHTPLNASFYAVNNQEFSFGHLTHSHLYRPVGYILKNFINVEVGTAWFSMLNQFFGIPSWLLILFYIGIGLIAAWFVLISLAYVRTHKDIAIKVICLIASIGIIKSLVDGAFMDLTALISVATMGILLKDKVLTYLPLPFLVADYFLWFTPGYLREASIAVALLLGFLCLHFAAKFKGYQKFQIICGAILCFAVFIFAGAGVAFFGSTVREEIASLPSSDSYTIPANVTVYFTQVGSTFPDHVTTTQPEPLSIFVAEHHVAYENYNDSIKIQGLNCDIASKKRILNPTKIFTPHGSTISSFTAEPWLSGTSNASGATALMINTCLPNTLPSLVRITKTLFPADKVILFAFLR